MKLNIKIMIGISSAIVSAGIITPIVIFSFKSQSKKEQQNNQELNIEHQVKKIQINKFEPLDFNNISKNEPTFLGGIQYTAYSQGFSFILNMAKQMGWNWEDKKLIDNLHNPNFDWDTLDITKPKKSKSQFDKNQTKITNFENYLIKKTIYKIGKNEYIHSIDFLMKKNNIEPQTYLWALINDLVWADPSDADITDNIDASTEVKINLNSNFSKLSDNEKFKVVLSLLNKNSNKIFPNWNYAYNWSGSELKKLAFQISNGKLLVWHYSEGSNQKSLKDIKEGNTTMHDKVPIGKQHMYEFDNFLKNILHNPDDFKNTNQPSGYSVQKYKNLDQIWLDPMGLGGSVEPFTLFTTVNTKANNKKTKLKDRLHFAGRFTPNGRIWYSNPEGWESVLIGSYNSFINGEKPGEVINKIYAWKPEYINPNKFYYPLKTFHSPDMISKFKIIKGKNQKQEFYSLFNAFFSNMKIIIKRDYRLLTPLFKKVSPLISSFLNFVKLNDFTEEEIKKAFDKLNNGSHYMLGVKIFLRGIKNMPKEQLKFDIMPIIKNSVKAPEIKNKTIVGMANTDTLTNLMNFMYNTKPYKKAGNFDPKTKKILFPIENLNENDKLKYFLDDKYSTSN